MQIEKQGLKKRKLDINTIIIFLVLYVSNDTLLFGTNGNRLFFYAHIGILLLLFIYLFFNVKTLPRQTTALAIVLLVFIEITQLVNLDGEMIKYIYNCFIILFSMIFVMKINRDEFIIKYNKILYVLSVFSIFLFILAYFANSLVRFFPSIANENNLKYYFFGLGFLEKLKAGVLPRSYGIFREPGVYACFLILALVSELFMIKKLSVKRALAFSVATLLTFSTAAFVIFFVILTVFFWKSFFSMQKSGNKQKMLLLLTLAIVLTLVVCVIGFDRITDAVFGKLHVENSSRDSRFGSVEANIKMFGENPIFGKGWNFVEDKFNDFASQGNYKGDHNTNTFLKILALYGIFPFLIISIYLYIFFVRASNSTFMGLFLFVIWAITLSNEDLSVNIVLYILPFYGCSNYITNQETQEKNIYCGNEKIVCEKSLE